MTSPWQEPPHRLDPREGPPEPRWLFWFVGATLVAYMIINIWRGLAGQGWNW